MYKRLAPEWIRAEVIAAMATQPGRLSKRELSVAAGAQLSEVQKTVQYYCEIGWLQKAVEAPRGRFEASPDFWNQFHDLVDDLDLTNKEQTLYERALEDRTNMTIAEVGSIEHDEARAGFLGRAAVLGGYYDLSLETSVTPRWFTGEHGWRSLVTIQALETAGLVQPVSG